MIKKSLRAYITDELQILFEVVKGNILEFAVHMASFYGLRRSEICGLKWCNIDFDKNTISISHTVITASVDGKYTMFFKDRAKNKKSRRTLPLVPQYRETLLMMKEQQNKNRVLGGSTYNTDYLEYIYVDALGKLVNPDRITHRFRMLFNEHPELRRIRFHDLRHSCASLLLNNGVEMKNIQEWLGHSSYNTTANIYTHLKSDSKMEAANIMSSVLQK